MISVVEAIRGEIIKMILKEPEYKNVIIRLPIEYFKYKNELKELMSLSRVITLILFSINYPNHIWIGWTVKKNRQPLREKQVRLVEGKDFNV